MAKILVAEDEPHIFRMIEFKLKALGHDVIGATDGGEAMEAATTQKPELILLDVMMPVMDGFQVLKKLKADDDTKEIPVIMLTAKSQERDVVTGLESGAEDYVVKPFSFPELLARINGALEKSR